MRVRGGTSPTRARAALYLFRQSPCFWYWACGRGREGGKEGGVDMCVIEVTADYQLPRFLQSSPALPSLPPSVYLPTFQARIAWSPPPPLPMRYPPAPPPPPPIPPSLPPSLPPPFPPPPPAWRCVPALLPPLLSNKYVFNACKASAPVGGGMSRDDACPSSLPPSFPPSFLVRALPRGERSGLV